LLISTLQQNRNRRYPQVKGRKTGIHRTY